MTAALRQDEAFGLDGGLADLQVAVLDAVGGRRIGVDTELLSTRDEDELRSIIARLEELRGECGCDTGAWSMGVAAVALPLVALRHGASSWEALVVLISFTLIGIGAAAVVGKVFGIAWYRVRWRSERRRLRNDLALKGR